MHTLFNKESAVNSLYPLAEYLIKDGEIIWLSTNIEIPSEEELQNEIIRLQAEYDSKRYQRDRQYPSWQEQADMQYWDTINGTTTWLDTIQAVKDAHPKGVTNE